MIAFDAAANGAEVTATSITFAHTCTGSDLILFVGALTGGGDLVTGATYNGVAMTQITKKDCGSSNFIYLFYLINPATGAHNVVVSQSASAFIDASSASYTGAKQHSQPNASTTAGATATSLTTTLTTLTGDCWTILAARDTVNGTISAGAGTTLRVGSSYMCLLDSNAAVAAGNTSLIFNTDSAPGTLGSCMAAFAPLANQQVIIF